MFGKNCHLQKVQYMEHLLKYKDPRQSTKNYIIQVIDIFMQFTHRSYLTISVKSGQLNVDF